MALATAAAAGAQSPVAAPGKFVPQAAIAYGARGDAAMGVDAAHPLPVAAATRAVTYTDRSGTIVAGGTAQQLAPANAARLGFFIQNLSGADLWLSSVGTATQGQPALRIAAGQLYESPAGGVPATALSVIGGATGQAFAAREW